MGMEEEDIIQTKRKKEPVFQNDFSAPFCTTFVQYICLLALLIPLCKRI